MGQRQKKSVRSGGLVLRKYLPPVGELRSARRIAKQVVFAVKRAVARGELQAGQRFPSVREIGRQLGINPNTAHRIVATLVTQGVLIAIPSSGTVIAERVQRQGKRRAELLDHELERIAVEAHSCDLRLFELWTSLTAHWKNIRPRKRRSVKSA